MLIDKLSSEICFYGNGNWIEKLRRYCGELYRWMILNWIWPKVISEWSSQPFHIYILFLRYSGIFHINLWRHDIATVFWHFGKSWISLRLFKRHIHDTHFQLNMCLLGLSVKYQLSKITFALITSIFEISIFLNHSNTLVYTVKHGLVLFLYFDK